MSRCPRIGKSSITKLEDCEYHVSSEPHTKDPKGLGWGEGGDNISKKSIKVLTIDKR